MVQSTDACAAIQIVSSANNIGRYQADGIDGHQLVTDTDMTTFMRRATFVDVLYEYSRVDY